MTSNSPLGHEEAPIENERDRIVERAQRAPGIAELMELYESAEAAYASAIPQLGVRVASSTASET